MQAVAGLCHFCETHGPRIVMVTQPVRDLTLLNQNLQSHVIGKFMLLISVLAHSFSLWLLIAFHVVFHNISRYRAIFHLSFPLDFHALHSFFFLFFFL